MDSKQRAIPMTGRDNVLGEGVFDLIVIGGGPAGVCGAVTAGKLGKRVLLIEKEPVVGGAGINTGTVPSKTLRETALVLSGWRSRQLVGIDMSLRQQATIADLMRHERLVKQQERDRAEVQLAEYGVTTVWGTASFFDSHRILIKRGHEPDKLVHGERILIATGSSPLRPHEFRFEDRRIHDSNEILELDSIPRRLVVIGGGVIGCEYAGSFAAVGSEVHLIDGRAVLLPFLDHEISQGLMAALTANGIRLHCETRVLKCDPADADNLKVLLTTGETIECDGVLVCAGRSSNTGDLNLTAAGITLGPRGIITVGPGFQSPEASHIYAAGDVVGAPALASTSIEQARIAIHHAFGQPLSHGLGDLLPTGIYTIPEVSSVGETEQSLIARDIPYIVGRCRYSDTARGKIIGDGVGFVKLLFDRSDLRLLGVHLMGEHATDLIHVGLIAMAVNAKADLFEQLCFNYPTLGNLYKYATQDALLSLKQGGRCSPD